MGGGGGMRRYRIAVSNFPRRVFARSKCQPLQLVNSIFAKVANDYDYDNLRRCQKAKPFSFMRFL